MVSYIVNFLFSFYSIMLMVRILSSWFPSAQKLYIVRLVYFYTEPYLKVFRKIIPPFGVIDLSPLIAIFALRFLQNIVGRILIGL